jgi:16S rRNA (guanine527-N7)-methyltransferase
MDRIRLAELLTPFLAGVDPEPKLVEQVQLYLDLLLRWNARMNLTAVRDPEQIVTRHFGESFFAAQLLHGLCAAKTLADVGSGAGFPGVPIKLLLPETELTLIESQNKKATFLREALRTLAIENAVVFCGRAEQWNATADVVTLRAVEKFERVLPVAAALVAEHGALCLLIGEDQLEPARRLLGEEWTWQPPTAVPNSAARRVAIAQRASIRAN